MTDITPIFAIFAGILMFFSSCLVPIVPSYIAYLTGINLSEISKDPNKLKEKNYKLKKKVFLNSLYFVLGFTSIFILLGITASFFGQYLIEKRYIIEKVGGVFVILLGFYLLGTLKIPILNKQLKFNVKKFSKYDFINSFLIGAAFGFAWVPCFSPILASILVLASISQSIWQGTYLLILFSLGIGIPFLLIGLTLSYSAKFLKKISKHLRVIQIIAGLLVIFAGIWILIGR